jgi:AcrR family transcriptional regulator
VDRSILEATIELIATSGLAGTTTQAIAQRAGVARATIYLRWPSRDAVVRAALRHAIGREPMALSGDIERDFHRGGAQVHAVLSQSTFRAVLPALVREFFSVEGTGVTFDALFPNRTRLAEQYDRLAGDQGFRTDVAGEIVIDTLIGSMLLHFMATTRAPTPAYRDGVVSFLIEGLRRR